ncbi:DMBT1 protein, partial [Atractosteus spatula]|nr:DMBT1 protein [Atractosteus spatula]
MTGLLDTVNVFINPSLSPLSPGSADVRLVNGTSPCEGTVEIYHEGQWGTIDDTDWDLDDAAVVCRQLGCGSAVLAPSGAHFGPGSGSVLMGEISCKGTESALRECGSSLVVYSHEYDVGVICSAHRGVRLVGGIGLCSGRVEVQHGDTWGSVCDSDFDWQDAEVVCRELDCGVPSRFLKGAHFRRAEGQVWTEELQCQGNESRIFSWFRLENGSDSCSGRVELQWLFRDWGTVCDLYWDLRDATILCQQLGCGEAVAAPGQAWFGQGSGPVRADVFDCQYNETNLSHYNILNAFQCIYIFKDVKSYQECYELSSLSSLDGGVRLSGGESHCDGQVEVYYNSTWGRLLQHSWGYREASVVCRQLGCGSVVQIYNSSVYETGDGAMCLTGIQCSGDESHLVNCSSPQTVNCSAGQEVSLLCSGNYLHGKRAISPDCTPVSLWDSCTGYKYYLSPLITGSADVRLVNGASPCEGTVEVYHGGEWGTVYDLGWGLDDAAVVCRQLGCGSAVSAPGDTHFGPGAGSVLLSWVECRGSESVLRDCRKREVKQYGYFHVYDAGVICSGTGVRLAGGRSLCSGRVEVLRGPSWGTICEADFDTKDAEVMCHQLDCGFPAELLRGAQFGKGQGVIRTEEIQCQGNETRIHDCPTSTREHQSCTHSNDISLVCTAPESPVLCKNITLCSYCTVPDSSVPCIKTIVIGYRLVGGPDSCSGRVELQYHGEDRTVCDQYWDLRDATVLCQQLGCGEAVAAPGQAWFGQGNGSTGVDVFDCWGNETHLSQCAVSSWGRAGCSHKQDVGVISSNSSLSALDGGVRLSGGESHCDGQVEVYYNSTWGRLLQHSFGYREASVVCRQLGCGSVVQIFNSSVYETGNSAVCLTGIHCSGAESHLVNCNSPQTVSCNIGQDVALLCSGNICVSHVYKYVSVSLDTISLLAQHSLRLVGGGDDCAGRLEVYHNGSWGTVCDDSWDLADSQVVCRQLQCGTALNAPVPASVSQGTGPIWLDKMECLGNESSLWECPSAGWGQQDCGHKEDVTVLCSERAPPAGPTNTSFSSNLSFSQEVSHPEHKQLRLSAGCSGQAEVYYNGTWGSICANNMTDTTAKVICTQLGCGDQGNFKETVSRLNAAPRWLDNIHCRKHDSTLWQCPSSPWGQNECWSTEGAEITCSVPLALRLAGDTNCSGRVELRYKGSWGTVCDDSWDLQDAQVVCRQLGCGDAVSAIGNSSFGRGNGTIWLDEVNCTSSELHLWDCCHSGLNQSDCVHKEDAGVICTGSTRTTPQTQPLGGLSISPLVLLLLGALLFVALALLVGLLIQNRKLRKALSKGALAYHDAVYEEIECKLSREGTYSATRRRRFLLDKLPSGYDDVEDSEGDPVPVDCDDAVPQSPDALSGELMSPVTEEAPEYYDDAVTVPQSPDSLSGDLMSSVKEEASEYYDDAITAPQSPDTVLGRRSLSVSLAFQNLTSTFTQERNWSFSREVMKLSTVCGSCWATERCSLGGNCCSVDVRLVNGASPCEGTLEIQYKGEWGKVYHSGWDLNDAVMVCRQLGCGSAVSAPKSSHVGPGSGSVLLGGVKCSGSESALRDCEKQEMKQYSVPHDCDAGVRCSETDQFSVSDFCILYLPQCKTNNALNTFFTGTCIQCTGDESHLVNCSSPQTFSCSTGQDVTLLCSAIHDPLVHNVKTGNIRVSHVYKYVSVSLDTISLIAQRSLRLVGAGGDCAGKLEVYHNDSWGTVCDDSWDLADSQVVCRQLQCGTALSAPVPASFSQGTGPIWLDEVGCLGNESSLWECPSAGWGLHDCGHKEDVTVLCSGNTNFTGLTFHYSLFSTCFLLDYFTSVPVTPHPVTCTTEHSDTTAAVISPRQEEQPQQHCPALSKGALTPYHDAIYEEIEYKLAREGTYSAPRRGRFFSDELPSGYDDVEDSEGDPVPGDSITSLKEEISEHYDDAVIVPQSPDALSGELLQSSHMGKLSTNLRELMSSVKEEAPEYYDDAVTTPHSPDALSGRLLSDETPSGYSVDDSEGISGHFRRADVFCEKEAPEYYDDAVTVPQSPDTVSGVPHTGPGVDRVLPTLPSEEGAPAPDRTDYDDVGDESQREDIKLESQPSSCLSSFGSGRFPQNQVEWRYAGILES